MDSASDPCWDESFWIGGNRKEQVKERGERIEEWKQNNIIHLGLPPVVKLLP